MKCVKCGNDCGDRIYCPYCGWSPKPGMENCLERERELQSAHQLYCPRCLSTRVVESRSDHLYYYVQTKPTIISSILRTLALMVDMAREDKISYVCLDCDNNWLEDP